MAVNETIVTGRKYRHLIDKASKLWQRISYWTIAGDVEFNDGKTAEDKLGKIDGISDALNQTNSRIALSITGGKTLQDQINTFNSSIAANTNNISSIVKRLSGLSFVTCTKSQYESGNKDPNTVYFIIG